MWKNPTRLSLPLIHLGGPGRVKGGGVITPTHHYVGVVGQHSRAWKTKGVRPWGLLILRGIESVVR